MNISSANGISPAGSIPSFHTLTCVSIMPICAQYAVIIDICVGNAKSVQQASASISLSARLYAVHLPHIRSNQLIDLLYESPKDVYEFCARYLVLIVDIDSNC